MRILAIDHGLARSGCAVCDPTGTIVRPIETVEPTTVEGLADVIGREAPERVVVGLPVSLGGEEGEQAQAVRAFASELAQAVDPEVVLYDERLTTRMAAQSAAGGAKAAPDSLAAAHLLEAYLASRDNQGEEKL